MKVFAVIIFVIVVLGLLTLIGFEVAQLVKKIKEYRNKKSQKKGE